jgi:Asp-tRNA(Asn)/Glu-tRNA(Gln) amidotransferase A subunit family amidase
MHHHAEHDGYFLARRLCNPILAVTLGGGSQLHVLSDGTRFGRFVSSLSLSIVELAAAIRRGELRAVDVLDECLARIDELDRLIHAWVHVDIEGAHRAAAEIDSRALRDDPRPLLGVPIGIKDIIDVAGLPTLVGSVLRTGHVAERDATVVAKLRAAGAVIIGKTVTTEWACFDAPPTRNPWSRSHSPGGSSSGSAAAVAARMCHAAIGTQTGGSILRPAAYCGIAGLKPTLGRVSRTGVLPVSENLDHVGPMAKSVIGLAHMLQAIAGYDERDPYSVDEDGKDFTSELARERPPRVGLIEEFYTLNSSEEISEATETALEKLRAAGAQVVSIVLPESFAEVIEMHARVMAAEISDVHKQAYAENPEAFGPSVRTLIESGLAMSQDEYRQALDRRDAFAMEMAAAFGDVDVLLTPTTDTTAPDDLGTTGRSLFQAPWSFAGLPAATIPCGLAKDGLPAGVQLIAREFEEARLLGAAAWCERVFDFRAMPPLVDV